MSLEISRKKLRHCIFCHYPHKTSSEIYEIIKPSGRSDLFVSDLETFCESSRISKTLLPRILECHRITSQRIRKSDFISFLEDEVTVHQMTPTFPDSLTDEQIAILSQLFRTLKSRKTQAAISTNPLSSERSSTSQLWVSLCRLAPANSRTNEVPVSTLCRLAEDMNLSFSSEELIDSLFRFFESRLERLTYEQFARLMGLF